MSEWEGMGRHAGHWHWAVGSGQWTVGSGQWAGSSRPLLRAPARAYKLYPMTHCGMDQTDAHGKAMHSFAWHIWHIYLDVFVLDASSPCIPIFLGQDEASTEAQIAPALSLLVIGHGWARPGLSG